MCCPSRASSRSAPSAGDSAAAGGAGCAAAPDGAPAAGVGGGDGDGGDAVAEQPVSTTRQANRAVAAPLRERPHHVVHTICTPQASIYGE